MMDQRLHRALHLRARRRHHLALFGQHRAPAHSARQQFLDALLHDPDRLPHLLHADDLPIVIVAVAADRNVEIHLLVAFIGLRLTQIPRCARAAHHHAGEAPAPAILEADDADIDVALLEDAVVDEKSLQIVAGLEEGIAPGGDVVDQLLGISICTPPGRK